jgi:spore coat polysaccharide biosynthesis predicted glycosyltransferase SpsG/CMP-N-acetylneuraminic acid synthetase
MTKRSDLGVVIPALKKAVAFQDDLVKNLDGVPLIERVIEKAKSLTGDDQDVYVLTDSEEIELIAVRSGVSVFCDPELTADICSTNDKADFLKVIASKNKYLIVLSPYAPLLLVSTILQAQTVLKNSKHDALRPVVRISAIPHGRETPTTVASLFTPSKSSYVEKSSGAFFILKTKIFKDSLNCPIDLLTWETEDELFEIESYHDWWVAEKLLKRKRIVFRVIGNAVVGMGHIYRALTLAHAITDHEVLFVCESKDRDAVDKLAGYDYWFESYESHQILDKILVLKPDLVINDILSTIKKDIKKIQKNGIRVINFEDLGSGASESNLTINELYDNPEISGGKVVWGHDYFFVRDEFNNATPVEFENRVTGLLLTFGGTDQSNLTRKMYEAIYQYCSKNGICIYVVTGPGYKDYDQLSKDVGSLPNVSITHDTGVISGIMERVQLAIASNGRTVYELAHMNIPSIVVSQHERESTHSFSTEENGFLNVGVYHKGETEELVQVQLEKLVNDNEHRRNLYDKMVSYNFDNNKNRVLALIEEVLDQ